MVRSKNCSNQTPPARRHIVFLAHSLEIGGAEQQIKLLATGMDQSRFRITVLLFRASSGYAMEFRHVGIQVKILALKGPLDLFGVLFRTARSLRELRPDLLYSFLDFPNVVSGLMSWAGIPTKIVWGVRASELDLRDYGISWRLWRFLQRRLVQRVNLVICNSHAGQSFLRNRGYPQGKLTVVSNGIDTQAFRPCEQARCRFRNELQLADSDFVVGHVARLDPMKDHMTLLRAFCILAQQEPRAKLICVGGGSPEQWAKMVDAVASAGFGDRIRWLGQRNDVPDIIHVFDLFTLCSNSGEGFPNVIGEAMASGLPCVVTDIGDSALIVGANGIIVPPRQPEALAAAWAAIIALDPDQQLAMRKNGRKRIVNSFSVNTMVNETSRRLEAVLADQLA